LKQKDIFLTNGAWRIAINVDMSAYQQAVATIEAELVLLEGHRKELASNTELNQITTLLNTFEVRLYNFQQLLPRLDRRRSLVNFGGTVLKTLFGTATVADIHLLHETLDGLQSATSDVVHSSNNQLTYVKKLDTATGINAMANATLSNIVSIVKDIAIQSHKKFQQVSQDVSWLNVTLRNYSELYTVLRQLEFAVLQMIHQTDELTGATQCVLQGKLPISLISSTTLQGILRKVLTYLLHGAESFLSS
jgi:hypothetical protein